MDLTMREQAHAALVAVALVVAALVQGTFAPSAYAAASILIWVVVITGLASRVLPVAPVARTAAVAGASLAGLAAIALASVAWASDQGRAFEEAVRASAYLGLFTLAVCTASAGGRRQWIAGLTVGLGAVSILALLSYLQPGLLDSGELERLIPSDAGRLSYPIGYWNGAAALLATAVILLAYSGARAPERWQRSLAAAVIPIALLGIWLTSSRGGAAAAVIGIVVLVAATGGRSRLLLGIMIGAAAGAVLIVAAEQMGDLTSGVADAARRADGDRMSVLAFVVALAAGGAAWLLDGAAPRLLISRRAATGLAVLAIVGIGAGAAVANPAERFREFKAPPAEVETPGSAQHSESSSGRWQFWSEAVDAFESAPVAGIGAGAYEDWWARNATIPVFVRNPHSLPLQEGAELGAVGVALLLAFCGAVGLAAFRRISAGTGGDAGLLLAVLVTLGISAAIDWTWEIPAVFAPAVASAGLLTASAPGPRLGENAYWLGLGTLGVAWVATIAAALVLLTELKLDQSRDAAAHDRIDQGIERALEARTVQPWSPEPYTQLALLEEARGNLDGALARLRQAEARDSEDWRLPLIEARVQRERGDRRARYEAIERVRDLNRLWPTLLGQR
jgi:O-Antigen ligase